ncbi:MAG TPA: hypothetical protein P5556_04800 [Candidatus Gastranaerophilales bacterium]|nr:hypothetical protein [Candidatus Gastranaerophilales bacterium]
MSENFWDRAQKRAYFKYLDRINNNLPCDSYEDWVEAIREESLENKIEEEAYLKFTAGYKNPVENWEHARYDVFDRLKFIAFYLHEKDINKSSFENWIEAQKIYIDNF